MKIVLTIGFVALAFLVPCSAIGGIPLPGIRWNQHHLFGDSKFMASLALGGCND